MSIAPVDIDKFDFFAELESHGRDYDKAVASLVDKYKLEMPRSTIADITLGVHMAYLRNFLRFGSSRNQLSPPDYGQQHRALEYIKTHNAEAYVAINDLNTNDALNQRIALVLSNYPELIPGTSKASFELTL